LKDSHYGGAKELGHGNDYQYSHNAPGGIAQQDYLTVDRQYYLPTDRGAEMELAKRWLEIRKLLGKSN